MNEAKHILVVEDEEVMYTVLVKILQEADFTVTHAKDGATALELSKQQPFDLILLDLMLPGLSGLDVLTRLKADEKTKGVPVFILSQLSDQDNISRGVSLGAAGYLVKSDYGLEDIVKKVKEFLKMPV